VNFLPSTRHLFVVAPVLRSTNRIPESRLLASLACIDHKSLEICDRCRLWQQNSPASAGLFCCIV
jgi:hypothetical protein